MTITVQLDLLEYQRKDQLTKGMPLYPALVQILLENPSFYWNIYNIGWQFPTQYLPLAFIRKFGGKQSIIITKGILEKLTQESENQINQKAYTSLNSCGDWLKYKHNSFVTHLVGSNLGLQYVQRLCKFYKSNQKSNF